MSNNQKFIAYALDGSGSGTELGQWPSSCVIEIPYSEEFSDFDKKNLSNISKSDVQDLIKRIKDHRSKRVCATTIDDGCIPRYLLLKRESITVQENDKLKRDNEVLKRYLNVRLDNDKIAKKRMEEYQIKVSLLEREIECLKGKISERDNVIQLLLNTRNATPLVRRIIKVMRLKFRQAFNLLSI